MSRAAATTDPFNAAGERRRRELIDVLAIGQILAVGELVLQLGISQPAVSKHLGVLRKVGLVTVSRQGQHRLYTLNARPLKPVYQWAKSYERFWNDHLDAVKNQAQRRARERVRSKNKRTVSKDKDSNP